MLFNTLHFAYFFALLLPVYWLLPHRPQNYLLLAASYYFYACWDPRFLSLLILSTVMALCGGRRAEGRDAPSKRNILGARRSAMILGMLRYYKYYNSVPETLHAARARGGISAPLPIGSAPVGPPVTC